MAVAAWQAVARALADQLIAGGAMRGRLSGSCPSSAAWAAVLGGQAAATGVSVELDCRFPRPSHQNHKMRMSTLSHSMALKTKEMGTGHWHLKEKGRRKAEQRKRLLKELALLKSKNHGANSGGSRGLPYSFPAEHVEEGRRGARLNV